MTDVPTEGPAFEAMMREIDAKLKAEGVEIPSRPISAVGEVSIRYGDIPIPLGDGAIKMPPELERHRPLAAAIRKWYDDTYGDRIKIDMSAGRIVLLLEGDLYTLRIPRFFGSVNFIVVREWLPKVPIGRGPATCNVVQLVDDMTPAMAKTLSDEALLAIWSAFEIGLPACYTLESTQSELMAIARSDVKVAVSNLMDRSDHFGASKWASLQSAEKVLKAAILLRGRSLQVRARTEAAVRSTCRARRRLRPCPAHRRHPVHAEDPLRRGALHARTGAGSASSLAGTGQPAARRRRRLRARTGRMKVPAGSAVFGVGGRSVQVAVADRSNERAAVFK